MKLTEQAVILFISKSITAGMLFILGPILVRFLTKADYGTYMQANLLVLTISTLIPLGLPQSLTYFIPRFGSEKHHIFVVRTLTALIMIGCVSYLVLFSASTLIGNYMNNQALEDLASYIGALIVVTIISDTTETILLANNKAVVVAIILPAKAMARVVGTIVPLLGGAGLKGLFEGIVLVMFAESVILYLYYLYQSQRQCHCASERIGLKEQLRYSLPVGAALMVGIWGGTIDKYIVALSASPEQYAVYARGAFDPPLLGIFPGMLYNLLGPRFVSLWSAGQKQEIVRLTWKAMQWIALLSYPIMCLCVVMAHSIITFLFTDSYSDSVPIFQVYMLMVLFNLYFFELIFRMNAKNGIVLKIVVVKIILTALTCAIIMKLLGSILGVVIGLVIWHGLAMLWLLYSAAKELRVSLACIIQWRVHGNILLLSVVAAMLTVPVTWLVAPKWLVLLTGGTVFALIFIPAALYLELFPESEKMISIVRRTFATTRVPSL